MTNTWENCELLADVVVANLPAQVKDDMLVWVSENWGEELSYDLAIARKSVILDSGLRLRHNTPHEVAIQKVRAYFSAWKYEEVSV